MGAGKPLSSASSAPIHALSCKAIFICCGYFPQHNIWLCETITYARARPLESAHLTAAWHASNANVILPDFRTASSILLLIRDIRMLMPAVQQWYNQSSLVEFYQDDNIRAGVKSYMGKIIMRNNTITGRLYRDEPAILAWDIMNEPQFPGDDTGKLLTVSCLWLKTICLGSAFTSMYLR